METASKSEDLRLPQDKSKFPNWESVFLSKVGGAAWSSNSQSILQHSATTPSNAAISKDLANLLNKCAIRGRQYGPPRASRRTGT
jgi:hypothetical protein